MKISEIASHIRERVPSTEIRAEDYVSTDNMRPNFGGIESSSSKPPPGNVTAYQVGDILLSNIRPYFRKTWLATHEGGCNADVLCIRANPEKCVPKYLYYLFTTDNFVNDYLKSCKGAKMPRGDVQRLLDYEFDLPDLPTQLRIAGVLGSIDEKIELNRKKIAELEALAKTIYDYWFVQFDFPDKNGKPYKSSGGKMVWNDQLKREVPGGWRSCTVGELCCCHDSKRIPLSGKQREGMRGDVPYYGATGVMDYVDKYIFDGEYLLFAEDGSVMTENGFPILQIISGKAWVNNHAHVLSPRIKCSVKFLQLHFRNIPVRKIKTGSIQPKITKDNLFSFNVLSIPAPILGEVDNILDAIQKRIETSEQTVASLTHQRDTLLPLLMNGQVEVAG